MKRVRVRKGRGGIRGTSLGLCASGRALRAAVQARRRPGALPSGPGYAKIASMAALPRALARGRKWEYFRSVKGSEWPTQRARETTSTDLDEEPVAVRHRCPYRRGLFRKASDHPATSGAGGHLQPKAGGASQGGGSSPYRAYLDD